MIHAPDIDSAAIAFVERRASAESYLLRVVLSAPAEACVALRKIRAMPSMIEQDDYQIMLAEAMALTARRKYVLPWHVLQNCIVGLREENMWSNSPRWGGNGFQWTTRRLVRLATWFGEYRLARHVAASTAVAAWRQLERMDLAGREAMLCWKTAEMILKGCL